MASLSPEAVLKEEASAKGPRGEKRPADVIGNAVRVIRIAAGEVEEKMPCTARS
jgi:hypothetical protein